MRSLFKALLIIAIAANKPTSAQQPAPISVVSTIKESTPSSAAHVDRAFRLSLTDRSRWSYRHTSCEDLGQVFRQPDRLAILTTAECWKQITPVAGARISASAGVPVYLYGRKGKLRLSPNDRIGIVASADRYRGRLEAAYELIAGGRVAVLPEVSTEHKLFDALMSNARKYDAVAVFEDGTGSSVASFISAASPRNVPEVDPIEVASAGKIGALLPSDGRIAAGALVVRTEWVANRVVPQKIPLPATAVALPLFDVPADERRPDESSSVLSFFFPSLRAAPSESGLPEGVSIPILITTPNVPPELVTIFSRAQLSAPIGALVNPCRLDQEDHYRSFLRASVEDAPTREVVRAMWEHAKLLQHRKPSFPQHATQVLQLEHRIKADGMDWLKTTLKGIGGDHECRASGRSRFRNNKLAYYERGLDQLRMAIREGARDKNGAFTDRFREASSCLGQAIGESSGDASTCGESLSGMWSTYYAPFLAAAVIEAESSRGVK